MKSLFGIFKNPRMLVIASYTAALYAAVVIPFKYGLPLVPGATEVRPGVAVLLLCSFVFGPAAAWGGAFGNLIGDFFGGTLGPGSLFGFPANFLYGYIPYKIWEATGGGKITGSKNLAWWARFILVIWVSSAVCAAIIAWGIEMVFHVPVMLLGGIIFSNNVILPIVITPALIGVIAPRLESWGLVYEEIEPNRPRPGALAPVGVVALGLISTVAAAFMIAGFLSIFLPGLAGIVLPPESAVMKFAAYFAQPTGPGGYSRAFAPMTAIVFAFVAGSFLLGHEKKTAIVDIDIDEADAPALPMSGPSGLSHVSFSYRKSDRKALSDVSLSIAPGEFVVLMGKTGAGKTTVARMLTGAIPHFYPGAIDGEVELLGAPVRCGPAANAHRVGIVFQDFESQLFSTNAELEVAFGAENLGVPRELLANAVPENLALVGLAGMNDRNPSEMSGGEKQRLAIASVLAMNQPMLILDEPSTDLDPDGKAAVFGLMDRLAEKGKTVLLIEHEIEAARGADRVVLMRDGAVTQSGSPDAIFADPDLLETHGIKPPDGAVLLKLLGLNPKSLPPADTATIIQSAGKAPRDDAYEKLIQADAARAAAYGDTLFELKGLRHSYENGKVALDGVDFKIRRGEFVAILGRNGSGKTTLAKHLNGLLKPTSGEALLDGTPVTSRPLSKVAREVGYVFQDPDHQIFNSTVAAEVSFAPKNFGFTGERLDQAVRSALEATSLIGYEAKDPFDLTKGERQRVAVAGALAGEPKALILDEPTTGLDLDEQRRVMELLRDLNSRGHTIVIITHTVWVAAQYAHRTALMSEGKIVADGPTRTVFGMTDKLAEARVKRPEIVEIGARFGKVFLSVAEFAESAKKNG